MRATSFIASTPRVTWQKHRGQKRAVVMGKQNIFQSTLFYSEWRNFITESLKLFFGLGILGKASDFCMISSVGKSTVKL